MFTSFPFVPILPVAFLACHFTCAIFTCDILLTIVVTTRWLPTLLHIKWRIL